MCVHTQHNKFAFSITNFVLLSLKIKLIILLLQKGGQVPTLLFLIKLKYHQNNFKNINLI